MFGVKRLEHEVADLRLKIATLECQVYTLDKLDERITKDRVLSNEILHGLSPFSSDRIPLRKLVRALLDHLKLRPRKVHEHIKLEKIPQTKS